MARHRHSFQLEDLPSLSGAGTTNLVAARNNRDSVGVELNPEYAETAKKRIEGEGYPVRVEKIGEAKWKKC